MCNTICIVEENDNKELILGLLLSLEINMPNLNCVISCKDETREFIEKYPKRMELNLDFINHIRRHEEFDCIAYVQNILNSLSYSIKTYGEVLYVSHTIFMVNKLVISDEIKEQGFGFIKKCDTHCDDDKKYLDYNFDIIYLRDNNSLEQVIENISDSIDDCENIINYSDYEYDEEKQKGYIDEYRKTPYKMSQTGAMIFLDKEMLVASEDFFAYKNSLNMKDIEKGFILNEIPITFLNIRFTDTYPAIQNINKQILGKLPDHGIYYMSIVNMKFSKDKLQFVIPNEKGIGIWNRTNDKHFLEELISLVVDKYEDYFTKVKVNIDYYSFNNFLLMDKPSYIWLNNTIKKYTSIELYNYDDTLKKEMDINELKYDMGNYIGLYPKTLFDYLEERIMCDNKKDVYELNEVPSTSEEYEVLLETMNKFTFCKFNEFNVQLIASALALGVIPIIDYKYELHGLEKNIHYIDTLTNIEDVDKETIIENINKSKIVIRSCEDFVVNLLDKIFVR